MLDKYVKPKDEVVYRRCKYIVEENQRLLSACEALQNGDLKTLGEKMYGSHDGLSKEYEVSCKELDFFNDVFTPSAHSARRVLYSVEARECLTLVFNRRIL